MNDQPQEILSSNTDKMVPQLEALQFLLGEWQAISGPGESTGGFRFVSQLQSRVILRTNYAEYPATSERPAYRHDDLMIIYSDQTSGLRADYYDSEGHVIRYAGQATQPDQVIFTSEPTASEPGFRLSYRLEKNGNLNGTFEIAAPNQAGNFMPYLSWSARKADSSVKQKFSGEGT